MMVMFADSIPDSALMAALGDDITYQINGKGYDIKAIVDKDVEAIGTDSYIPERRTEIEFIKDHLPRYPKNGDQVIFGGYTMNVDRLISDDGVYVRLAMRMP